MQTVSHGSPVGSNNLSQPDSSQEDEIRLWLLMKETQYWCIRFYSAAQRAHVMRHFKDSLMMVKIAIIEKEWSTGVAWQTAGPMSQL